MEFAVHLMLGQGVPYQPYIGRIVLCEDDLTGKTCLDMSVRS
jgi:hypothetical protein